jgi:hypothetical protein
VNGIHDEVVTFNVEGIGTVLAVLPTIPEDAPYKVREGIARRRIAATTGTCPCGATVDYLAAITGTGVCIAEVHHDRLCPADTDKLVKAVRRWVR